MNKHCDLCGGTLTPNSVAYAEGRCMPCTAKTAKDTDSAERKLARDELLDYFANTLPPAWRAMYTGCVKEGFSKEEAYGLLVAYIHASDTGGLNV